MKMKIALLVVCFWWSCTSNQLEPDGNMETSSSESTASGTKVVNGGGSLKGSSSSEVTDSADVPLWLEQAISYKENKYYIVESQNLNWRRVQRLRPFCSYSGELDSVRTSADSLGLDLNESPIRFWEKASCKAQHFEKDSANHYTFNGELSVLEGVDRPSSCFQLEDVNDLFGLLYEGFYHEGRELEIAKDTLILSEKYQLCFGMFYKSIIDQRELALETETVNCDSLRLINGKEQAMLSVLKSDSSYKVFLSDGAFGCVSKETFFEPPKGLCGNEGGFEDLGFQSCALKTFPKFFNTDSI